MVLRGCTEEIASNLRECEVRKKIVYELSLVTYLLILTKKEMISHAMKLFSSLSTPLLLFDGVAGKSGKKPTGAEYQHFNI
jgi:hypothetical protein